MAKKMAATAPRGKAQQGTPDARFGNTIVEYKTQTAPEIVSPELMIVEQNGSVVRDWLGAARQFFRETQEMELAAKSFLMRAESLAVPTNGDQDEQLQAFIRDGNSGIKAIEAKWTITRVLHQLHGMAVAGRKRGTDAYLNGVTIGNRLHNQWSDNEKRRAQQESDRLRREAEANAARERQEELDRLEREALRAEAQSDDLSAREQEFVDRVTNGGNTSVLAARYAGYKDPEGAAARLMNTPKIKAAIEGKIIAKRARQQQTALKESPVQVESTIVDVQPDTRGGDRTTWSADILDERAFVQAVVSGQHGIPLDCLTINQVRLNELARSLHENMDRFPGVRARKTTRVL